MDFPSFNHQHHHHNRYVPPPPPPQRNFSDEHYTHRHRLHLHLHPHPHPPLGLPPPPPLPYPPPPPAPPLPVPPPPPSYNPHQSNFTFLDAQTPSFLNHRRSSPPQPRFSNRFDYRTDSWSDPPHRNPLLPDDHHRRLISQSETYYNPNASERAVSSSRYRDDVYARRDILTHEQHLFRGSPNDNDHHGRYASARSVADTKKPTGSSSRIIEEYEPRYMTTSEEDRIWDHHGDEDPRPDHSMKGKRNEFGHGGSNGVSYVNSKEQYQYEYEPSKFTRVREGREEFKQVQKKSVLLRIGKPNNTHRNRNHEQHFSKPHMVESNNSNSRGKDKDHIGKDSSLYLDQKTEGNREHSPVELDVSFKSNALVAKAVATPSSPVFDNNHSQPRNKKIKRASEFGSPLSKFNERLTRSGNSSNGSECPSSSEKDSKQLIAKDSVVKGSLSGPPVLGQSGVSNGPLSFRLRKKRKIMKLGSLASSFQLAEKDDKSVQDENIKKIPSAPIPIRSVISFPPIEELIAIKADKKSSQAIMVSEKDGLQVENHDINPTENKTRTPQLSENEVLVNLENDSTQKVLSEEVKVVLAADTDMFASSWQDEIETQKESYTNFDTAANASVEMQDITAPMNSLGPCLDEIITLSPENGNVEGFVDDVSRKEEGTIDTEDAPLNAEDNTIDESYLPVIKRKMKISEVVFSLTTPCENEISCDKDEVTEMETLKADDSRDQIEIDLISKDESNDKSGESGKSSEKTMSNTSSPKNDVDICAENGQLESSTKTSHIIQVTANTKTSLCASQGTSVKTPVLNTKTQGPNLPTKKPQGPTTKPISASRVFTRMNNPTNNITKPRTWHRSTTVPPLPNKQMGVGPSSYIRSGNTLVRKGAPVTAVSRPSIYQLGPIGPVVRPKTPPLLSTTKLAEHVPVKANCEEPIEDQNGKINGTLEAVKKIQYVKRKSNQLVAADQELGNKTQTSSSSDGYYKRRKNQLIRTSDSDVQKVSKINIKRHSGVFKKYKHLKFPSVWTLSSQSSGKDGVSLRHLFPWKRSRYAAASIPTNTNSSSSISGKLLLSRKREMIYTRSKHGFSLRMSKLLSVGASSLKWSKSIERNSKRANEEATLAVAAAEKKKREQNGSAEIKTRNNNMSRDRIFRIGLVRYKMDPSRRTLQRISDEEPSTSMQSKEEIRRPYVPKRLLIGHNEYVRIGNGNQLVRNPKRRTRIFANEKVRWSLHTARSRLAKKKKYCQFFTRFGKCNKDDGKCPYIHDSSKIAVCTKFLNGSCSNPSCNLTHKVIPERMQDCSYFSQGLCSNVHCPYRHVNVNSAASVCEGFLKGYCADGNECRKKHTYACPEYEATGACPQGTKCKLHHPKNRNTKGLKRKQQQQKNARGRYFGSNSGGVESITISDNHLLKDDDILCQQGKFAEYISLDLSNEDVGDVTSNDQTTMVISEPTDLGGVDFDELMKPVRIMN